VIGDAGDGASSYVLELVEATEPHAADGQVRMQVRGAGVNAMVRKLRTGQLQEMMPLTLASGTGVDASGVVCRTPRPDLDAVLGSAGPGRASLRQVAWRGRG